MKRKKKTVRKMLRDANREIIRPVARLARKVALKLFALLMEGVALALVKLTTII